MSYFKHSSSTDMVVCRDTFDPPGGFDEQLHFVRLKSKKYGQPNFQSHLEPLSNTRVKLSSNEKVGELEPDN